MYIFHQNLHKPICNCKYVCSQRLVEFRWPTHKVMPIKRSSSQHNSLRSFSFWRVIFKPSKQTKTFSSKRQPLKTTSQFKSKSHKPRVSCFFKSDPAIGTWLIALIFSSPYFNPYIAVEQANIHSTCLWIYFKFLFFKIVWFILFWSHTYVKVWQ